MNTPQTRSLSVLKSMLSLSEDSIGSLEHKERQSKAMFVLTAGSIASVTRFGYISWKLTSMKHAANKYRELIAKIEAGEEVTVEDVTLANPHEKIEL